MPVWHAKTEKWIKSGQLQSLGIVQEQHPDRAALYMQWQKMDWPVLADPFNLLGVQVVPITLLVDESGVIRFKNPSTQQLKQFVETTYPKVKVSHKVRSFDGSLKARREAVKSKSADAIAHFQYGVALRQRFDSKERKSGDFAEAMEAWQKALEMQPDQYIWRRRIQQYGPRLDKPYSFYDWVNEARVDLEKRGVKPLTLTAEPRGSEFAHPSRGREKGEEEFKHPDPKKLVPLDAKNLVTASCVVVPSTKGDGAAVRVHLRFQPAASKLAHWTNDAGNVSFHLEGAEGLMIHDRQGPGNPPARVTSAEERVIEFELRPKKGRKLPEEISGAAYYYVCEGLEGECQYLRQAMTLRLRD